jgi:hypothetical protein
VSSSDSYHLLLLTVAAMFLLALVAMVALAAALVRGWLAGRTSDDV